MNFNKTLTHYDTIQNNSRHGYRVAQVFITLMALLMCSIAIATPAREVIDFTRGWKFSESDHKQNQHKNFDDRAWRELDVPHDYIYENGVSESGSQKQFGGYHGGGVAWYRKSFTHTPSEKHVIIEFDGVYMNSEVWINGEYLGKRPYGYISFRYDLTKHLASGKNVVAVRVDNRLQPSARWYHPGGIYAPVRLIKLNPIHIKPNSLFVTTPLVTDNKAHLHVAFDITPNQLKGRKLTAVATLKNNDGKSILKMEENVAGNRVAFEEHLIHQPKLWSPETPYLYQLDLAILEGGNVVDQISTSVGIRSIVWETETGFWLNGENIKLKGVSEHYEGGPVGGAWTKPLLKWKLSLLKEMGVNAVRVGHNPYPPMFYELCDELGLMVMDEIFDGWLKKAAHDYGAHHFDQWWQRDIQEWVTRNRNHPSIILYSVGNETHGDIAPALVKEVKKYDHTRLVTSGSANTQDMDVAGINGGSETKSFLETKRFDKPFVSTEAPHTWQTRGYYRTQTWWRDGKLPNTYELPNLTSKEIFHYEWTDPKNWHNRKQHLNSSYDNATVRISARKNWEKTRDLPYHAGHFRWTGFDYHGESGLAHGGWPFILFMGGALDVAGLKKDLFYFYQSQWTDQPMLHILPSWTHPTMPPGTGIPVWIYSNVDEVELFLNGKSLGKDKPEKIAEQMQCEWVVPWQPGELTAVGYKNNKQVIRKTLKTASEPVTLKHEVESFVATGSDRKAIIISSAATDSSDQFSPYAQNKVFYHHGSNVKRSALENGSPVDHTNRTSSNVRGLFMGKTRAFFEATASNSKGDKRILTIGAILGDESLRESRFAYIDVQQIDLETKENLTPDFTVLWSLNRQDPNSFKPYSGALPIANGDTIYAKVIHKGKTLLQMEQQFGDGVGLFWGNEKSARMWVGKGITLQAEQAEMTGPLVSSQDGKWFKGKGFVNFQNQEGTLYWYHENDGDDGRYKIRVRYTHADPDSERPMTLTVNGKEIGLLKFASTNSWREHWRVATIEAVLKKGANDIELKTTGKSGPIIDQLALD